MKPTHYSAGIFTLSLLCLLSSTKVCSQQHQLKVAVFAPIYIDSAFLGNNFKFTNAATLPKNILPGLDFYNGITLAIDSLQAEHIQAEVLFYDTKDDAQPISNILKKSEMNDVSLIIASFTNNKEMKPLADFAATKKIPLISATFPNDGGIINNPYFIILNSTLKTHCESLYKYLQRYYATENIVLLKRKGLIEDFIQAVFIQSGKTTPGIPLKIKSVQLNDTFTAQELLNNLDSNRKNVLICATMNEAFAVNTVKTLSTASLHYTATVIGMPNWENIKELDNTSCKDVDIIYSTPYLFSKADKEVNKFIATYNATFSANPSEWAFKGFEAMYHFTKIVLDYGELSTHFLSEKKYKLFNEFSIQPVYNKYNKLSINYFENKKLYFIKKSSGKIKLIN